MREWWKRSPEIGVREVLVVSVAAIAVAVVQFMPLVTHLSTHIATDLGDPLSQSWQIAWGGHAILHQPLAFWQSNQFWPATDTLAFSDALVGLAPFGMLGGGAAGAVRNYNLALLFAFSLAFVAVYLLARELDTPPWAAAVAGAAFAWSPFRLWQAGHMHVVSSGGIALALFLLLRGYRRGSSKLIIFGWLTAGWLASIGFTLGIQLDYLLLVLGIIGGVCWWRSGKPRPQANVIWATVSGVGGFLLITWLVTRPYLRVTSEYPRVYRPISAVMNFSPDPLAFLTPPRQSLLWGDLTAGLRPATKVREVEGSLYPGLVAFVMAAAGLSWKRTPKALRVGLGLGVLGFAVLSLGVHKGTPWRFMPYRFLYDFLPGWDTMRTPGRLQTLTTLALALLAAMGAARFAEWIRDRKNQQVASLALAGVVTLVLLDGSGLIYPQPAVPMPPIQLASVKGPYLQLPAEASNNRRYLVWSTDGFPKMVNGRSSFTPPVYRKAIRASKEFPSATSIRQLRALGITKVVIHTEFGPMPLLDEPAAHGMTWNQAIAQPYPQGMGVRRTLLEPLVIYEFGAG
jgi:hypothetical protein